MSSEHQEWLSAASDNQSVSAQQLDLLLSDPDLQASWLRYQLAGTVLRQELTPQLDINFADRFSAVLEQEEAHQLVAETVPVLQPVTATAVTGSQPAANQGWWKMLMQGAIAASVALVAVVGVQQTQQKPDDVLTTPLPVLQTSPIGGVAAPVSLSQTSVESRFTPQQQQLQLEQQRRLQELMQARQQQIRLMEQAAAQQAKNAAADEGKGQQQ
ncbi:MAG: RseA family anti-sigma factor [Chromatiaceae bacterium]